MMKADLYWIDDLPKGLLGIAARPRGGDWLDDEIRALRKAGVDVLVSVLTAQEAAEFHLGEEQAACQRLGLEFRSLPIPDRGVPRSVEAIRPLVAELCRDLESGKGIAVHCRQGIGRSSLVVASVLVASGESLDRAWQRVQNQYYQLSIPGPLCQQI